ncbi:hypothetical protein CQ017_11355 [Arthrobacter sp. MYb224]|uniref:hypothetical protein n=1 Tax=unclassified Arthrobacter TaxID=235627 RepID=UPI000CFBFED7|nr:MULTISPECIES: hypothetical protein [unclassified Arthrobacter]PQZ98207.1 hypothetical protein CQ017_11355 [Arthrobacter sp. MYb224]PRA02387.1 hypothetical protein CQ019_13035 [Arthrobacter sp. MYb229]PRB50670.1 hypothetical protein CQ013_11790 [Arthrobacter sp. MYb216]
MAEPAVLRHRYEIGGELAEVFIASETSAGAKSDAYFESDGKRLLSHFLLAAAIANRPIAEVFIWAQYA